ncbi:hypothetical protein LPJ66_004775 [Kickxella alabastrina]|uniref:Uncharacterized protein n=1 Tax=Kickxella alabastrina TaxID=61397 RepID=A0ACC1IGZ9_9FUNG|nr:hypothetical protein LPJ66_004775 [Kickxella alabastrina]
MGNQLSFSLTESELERQKAGVDMDMKVDPRGKADKIMLIVISTIYSIDFVAVLYMLWNIKYPPLKAKNPTIMTLVMISSIVWFVGDLQTNGHVPLANTPMTNCKAFGIWARLLSGVCLYNSLISLRAYGMYRVFYLHRPYHGLGLYLPYFLYILCLIAFGVVAQVLSPAISTVYVSGIDICSYTAGFKAAMFGFLGATVLIGAIALWKVRSIKSSFNESREMMLSYIIMVVALAFAITVSYIGPKYTLDVRLRIIFTSLSHFLANILWWLIMGVPMYKCLFDHERYLKQWISKLRKDGLQKEYDIDSNTSSANSHRLSSSYNRNSTLLASNNGYKKGGNFYPMEESVYEDGDSIREGR